MLTDTVPNVLSIAGSDPSGGAGVQADLKTFAALQCHGMAVVAALTAQNTRGVYAVHIPPVTFLKAQIDAIFADIAVAGVKIGMLGNADTVATVADRLRQYAPAIVILDPVLTASSGDALSTDDVRAAMMAHLLPLASLVTPNLAEIARLTESRVPETEGEMLESGRKLLQMGAQAVLVKGGHLPGAQAIDLLVEPAGVQRFSAAKLMVAGNHGTGCTLSSAIAAYMARGMALAPAVAAAKAYVRGALTHSGQLHVGRGVGPLQHFFQLWPGTRQ
ncbi:MAG: bifunctional hydroxymethylpyrimidine kinase/phosphomethylpyrimidine kinase [Hyphomicrobiales bacterium]|nr:bifunctional hydroxymethylpyrimidine kinase/phosphomethylpyrimidine kinase [Hyphomicrobiales bacterium]MDE2116103.1 bifunctional hydroxymethylpyrimidine kinase/phosphomethylpyrimidine kinase [Hyphomicrobiales bacterium]